MVKQKRENAADFLERGMFFVQQPEGVLTGGST